MALCPDNRRRDPPQDSRLPRCGYPKWRAGRLSEGVDKLPVVATGKGGLALERVQPAGKREQSGAAWLNGHRSSVGAVLPS